MDYTTRTIVRAIFAVDTVYRAGHSSSIPCIRHKEQSHIHQERSPTRHTSYHVQGIYLSPAEHSHLQI